MIGALFLGAGVVFAMWPLLRSVLTLGSAAEADAPQASRQLAMVGSVSNDLFELRFIRANGAIADVRVVRERAGEPWRPEATVDAPGIVMGDGYPVFATLRFMAVHGIDPNTALRPLTEEILDEIADEVTVIRGWGGEVAVCLWQRDKVVRAYLAGEIFELLLRDAALTSREGRGGSDRDLACTVIQRIASDFDRDEVRTAALAAALASCAGLRDLAIDSLSMACDAGALRACDLLMARAGSGGELWPEVDDLWRWIFDIVDGASPTAQ
ncbi:MAG: hypothetical protein KF724_08825 [Phycisphaeraceae bacterium]|nr:hypothetical protein [Phycisphaeraceae bacterium]